MPKPKTIGPTQKKPKRVRPPIPPTIPAPEQPILDPILELLKLSYVPTPTYYNSAFRENDRGREWWIDREWGEGLSWYQPKERVCFPHRTPFPMEPLPKLLAALSWLTGNFQFVPADAQPDREVTLLPPGSPEPTLPGTYLLLPEGPPEEQGIIDLFLQSSYGDRPSPVEWHLSCWVPPRLFHIGSPESWSALTRQLKRHCPSTNPTSQFATSCLSGDRDQTCRT